MNSFLDIIQATDHLTADEKTKIITSIQELKVKKGDVLQNPGDLRAKAFYVKKGLLRSYTIDDKGKEHVFMFGPEGWVVGDMEYHIGAPAVLYVDALEDSEIEMVEQSKMDNFLKMIPSKQLPVEAGRLVNRIRVLQKRIILLMSATALERYEDFVETYPKIVQRVPQRMIASYLGVTPEALSKVKSAFLKHK
jgi:CRP-like cAMP-binding protein